MIIDTNKAELGEAEKLLKEISIWRKDAKKFKQTALYDLLSETEKYIKSQGKEYTPKKTGFTLTPADKAFSNFIRSRANWCCERCGTQYEPNTRGLQCSHHFSRRYYNIRYDPDNAVALCYNCHVYWYQKDIPEAYLWLEQKIGKAKIDRLIKLKNQPQVKQTQSELDEIVRKYQI